MEVRLATEDDAEGIRTVYNREVLEGTATFDLRPRSPDEQRRWLIERSGAHAVVVATEGTRVVGFGSLSPYRDRPAYRTTVEDSVYVVPEAQGLGVGGAMLDELLEVAGHHGFHTVVARISGHNEASVALHRRRSFELVGVEREVGRKFSRWLDVVVMQLLVSERPSE